MTPFEEPKEPVFWLPFTRTEIRDLERCILFGESRGIVWNSGNKIVEFAKEKLRCADALAEMIAKRDRGPIEAIDVTDLDLSEE